PARPHPHGAVVRCRLRGAVRQRPGHHEDGPATARRPRGLRPRTPPRAHRGRGRDRRRHARQPRDRDGSPGMRRRCDVLVVGGGLLGCTTAFTLAKEGADVVLLERDQINQHASGQNAGSLHFLLEYRMVEDGLDAARKAAEAMPLHLDASARWDALAAEVGPGLGLARDGGLMLADDAATAQLLEAKSEIERGHGLDVRVLDGDEAREIAPYLSDDVVAAAFCPTEGKANARTAAPAVARAASAAGAAIRSRTAVTGLRRDGADWVASVRSQEQPSGTTEEIRASAVVLAAGVWTRELGLMVGVDLPVTVL